MIRHVFFDLGLTLAENDLPELYQQGLQKMGHAFDLTEVKKAYHLANKFFMREQPGKMGKAIPGFIETYLEKFGDYLGISIKGEHLLEEMATLPRPTWRKFSFTDDTLVALHNMGISTGLISNWDVGCRDVLKRNGLLELLSPIVVSAEEGVEKPNVQIFEIALQKAGITAEQCLYVGDNYYDDYKGACQLGIPCCIINPNVNLGIEEIEHPYIIENAYEVVSLIQNRVFNKGEE